MPGGRPYLNTPERMKALRIVDPETGCWLWPKHKDRDGYGRFSYKGRLQFVHRLSYEFWVGPIESGKVIMHVCDNPPCYNPKHLRQGTSSENRQDCVKKGRMPNRKGQKNINAKLSLYQVHLIRELSELGMNQDELSLMFNITRAQIRKIIYKKNWID